MYPPYHLNGFQGALMVIYNAGVKENGGIRIAPSVPSEWDKLEINKSFRGKKLHIVVKNPDGHESGFRQFKVNGVNYDDNYIPATDLADMTEVEVLL